MKMQWMPGLTQDIRVRVLDREELEMYDNPVFVEYRLGRAGVAPFGTYETTDHYKTDDQSYVGESGRRYRWADMGEHWRAWTWAPAQEARDFFPWGDEARLYDMETAEDQRRTHRPDDGPLPRGWRREDVVRAYPGGADHPGTGRRRRRGRMAPLCGPGMDLRGGDECETYHEINLWFGVDHRFDD